MAKGFKCGAGGGAGLNFSVTAYSSDVLPASAQENAIAIITDVPVSGWVFSMTEPAAPATGLVWFTLGKQSAVAFNALKKNAIELCPLAAKQREGDAWVDIPAYSYIGGEWGAWVTDVYLFNAGDPCYEVTGGWVGSWGGSVRDTVLYLGSDGLAGGQVYTVGAVDVTPYSRLKLAMSANTTTVYAGLLEGAPTDENWGNDNATNALAKAESTGLELECDVSALTGPCYIWISRAGGGTADTVSAAVASVQLLK